MKTLVILTLLILLSGCARDLFDDNDRSDIYERNYYRSHYYHNTNDPYHASNYIYGGGGNNRR